MAEDPFVPCHSLGNQKNTSEATDRGAIVEANIYMMIAHTPMGRNVLSEILFGGLSSF